MILTTHVHHHRLQLKACVVQVISFVSQTRSYIADYLMGKKKRGQRRRYNSLVFWNRFCCNQKLGGEKKPQKTLHPNPNFPLSEQATVCRGEVLFSMQCLLHLVINILCSNTHFYRSSGSETPAISVLVSLLHSPNPHYS